MILQHYLLLFYFSSSPLLPCLSFFILYFSFIPLFLLLFLFFIFVSYSLSLSLPFSPLFLSFFYVPSGIREKARNMFPWQTKSNKVSGSDSSSSSNSGSSNDDIHYDYDDNDYNFDYDDSSTPSLPPSHCFSSLSYIPSISSSTSSSTCILLLHPFSSSRFPSCPQCKCGYAHRYSYSTAERIETITI